MFGLNQNQHGGKNRSQTKSQKSNQINVARSQLNQLLLETGIAYIDANNQLCTSEPHSAELNEVIRFITNTPNLFGGELYGIRPRIIKVNKDEIEAALTDLQSEESGNIHEVDETKAAERTAKILKEAVDKGASDIHIRITDRTFFLGRIDGRLKMLVRGQDRSYGISVASYIFNRLAHTRTWAEKADLDGRFSFVVNKKNEGDTEINWRISQMPAEGGPKITIRNLDASSLGSNVKFTDLGLSEGHAKYFWEAISATNGTVIITGPTGSGKTTLICLGILKLSENEDKLIQTLEDPPEWLLQRINVVQTEVTPDIKVSQNSDETKGFAYFGRKVLRNDTDIVFMGELRERKAAMVALRMGETGQVCLTTLHANSGISGVGTLIEQFDVNPALLASPGVLRGVGHQRLTRRLCKHCSLTYEQAAQRAKAGNKMYEKALSRIEFYIEHTSNIVDKDAIRKKVRFKNLSGCPHCNKGEKGRIALFEFVVVDDIGRKFIMNRDINGWEQYLRDTGWPSIKDHAVSKILNGVCDVLTVESTLSDMVVTDIENAHDEMRETVNG